MSDQESKIIGSGNSYKKIIVSFPIEELSKSLLLGHSNGKTYVKLEIIEKFEKDKYKSNAYVKQLDANPSSNE